MPPLAFLKCLGKAVLKQAAWMETSPCSNFSWARGRTAWS